LSIPTSTVNDTIKRYKETGSEIPDKCPGHLKILNQRDKWTLQHIVRNNRFASLSDITSRLISSLDTTLHNNTVRKYLYDEEFGSYVARKKPLLTQKQQKDRLKWSREKRNWGDEWKKII
ncbi:18288_t:CDS:1, partial [Funneliformis geosporum]